MPSYNQDWKPLDFPANPAEPAADWWLAIYERAWVSRAIDELELTKGYKPSRENPAEGKLKFQFSAKGHELPQLVAAALLNHPHDGAGVYYRSRPFMLGVGLSPFECFASVMHKTAGVSGGRDIGVVFNHKQPGGITVLPASGDVGAQYTPAVGWAQSIAYRTSRLQQHDWDGAIAITLGGDGSTATNGFWAALNIITPLNYPMVIMLEDNAYALTVPLRYQTSGPGIIDNISNFHGLSIVSVAGWQPLDVYAALHNATTAARDNGGPQLVHVRVPRLTGHNFQDSQPYKTRQELEQDIARDPLTALAKYLREECGVSTSQLGEIEAAAHAQALQAGEAAWEHGGEPQPGDATRHVFAPARHIEETTPSSEGQRVTMQAAINACLAEEMERDKTILVFGEDVGGSGGVHRVTDGLQKRFGEERVFDTSLNEEGIVGRAVGMAINGLRPVPEIQFRKYADPAHEQITDAGSLRWRTNGRYSAPLVLRMPVGYQRMGGDPWHAVCGEAVFAHLPGWQIAYPSNAADAVGLLRTALRGDDPVLFLEHRYLYEHASARRPYPGPDYIVPFGKAATMRPGRDALVVTWGDGVHRAAEAASILAESGQEVEILDLRTIVPYDKEAMLNAVQRIGKVLIVHEDNRTCGFGAELAAVIVAEAFSYLDAPVWRVTAEDVPVPCNDILFEAMMPTTRKVHEKLVELLDFLWQLNPALTFPPCSPSSPPWLSGRRRSLVFAPPSPPIAPVSLLCSASSPPPWSSPSTRSPRGCVCPPCATSLPCSSLAFWA